MGEVTKDNVGRVAERIAMNELEVRGFRVTDLNKEGLSANADFLAAKGGRVYQVQVKGAANKPSERLWFNYGYCSPEIIAGEASMFNRKNSFYTASIVVFVAIRNLRDYHCIVMPVEIAEKAARLNLEWCFRTARLKDGAEKKPGKVWGNIEPYDRKWRGDQILAEAKKRLFDQEQQLIASYREAWERVFPESDELTLNKTELTAP